MENRILFSSSLIISIKYILTILIAISLPYSLSFNTYFIIILVAITLIETFINKGDSHWHAFFGIMALLYILNIIGLAYTDNLSLGLKRLETQASFLAFPFIFSRLSLNKKQVETILLLFALSCFIAILICETSVAVKFINNKEHPLSLEYFISYRYTYQQLTNIIGIHTAYLGLYIVFSNIILLDFLNKTDKFNYQFIITLVLLIQSLFIFQLASKNAIIVNSLIITLAVIYSILRIKKYSKKVITAISFVGFLSLVYFIMQFPISRVLDRYTEITKPSTKETRIDLWSSAYEVIQNNWLIGVGTGDVDAQLINTYKKNNLTIAIAENYNTHNQYFDYVIRFGIIGYVLFMLFLIISLINFIKKKETLFAGFIIICSLAFITENMLSVQKGIVFFSLFICIFNSQLNFSQKNINISKTGKT